MSNNIQKKLEIKSELLRHLDTATTMMNEDKPSSLIKVIALKFDIIDFDLYNKDPNLGLWREILV